MAGYIIVQYTFTSTTEPTMVARYEYDGIINPWWDKVTLHTPDGPEVTLTPYDDGVHNISFYGYQFTGNFPQSLCFFPSSNKIPDYAFIACENIILVDLRYATDVTQIGEGAFSLLYNMTDAHLSDSITSIGRNCFEQDYDLSTVNIPSGLTVLETSTFAECHSLSAITIPDQVSTIQNSAFFNCSGLTEVYLGSGLTSLGVTSFGNCTSLTSITATSENAQSVYNTTFQNVHTGGTLYYPADYESEYGSNGGWLSTDQYMLGYYAWSGVSVSRPKVYLNPTSGSIGHRAVQYGACYVFCSGCSIINSATSAGNFTYTVSGDNFINSISAISQSSTDRAKNRFRFYPKFDQNTAPVDRVAYIQFTFYDTSGNTYNDTFKLVQTAALELNITPNVASVSSTATSAYTTVTGINETFASFEYSAGPDTDYGRPYFPIISAEKVGNDIVFTLGPNGTSAQTGARISLTLISESGNSYMPVFHIWKDAYTGPKNIYASISDVNVGSGSNTTSGYVFSLACTYDHFTYMTGGSMSVGVSVDSNGIITLTTPSNGTSNSRVGYVYITFYDTDGNQYFQTITIRQAAGTGPGPGPQPEPTWNVITSLTISDNEQHRFFVEAELGKSYKANGIEYKTVSACEARYSLYYINSYGGVDVLPFKGRGNKKTDNVTRFNYTRSFRNNTLEFENVNYMNEMKATWQLKTGWMTDKQSKKMKELVESTFVYLYDAQEQEYIPVVMTDKTLEYKTYHNQNNRFYNYTITVEESQSKERR